MTFELREPTLRDAAELTRNMRPADAAEVMASGGFVPFRAVVHSMCRSSVAHAAFVDGELVAIFGVVPIESGVGAVWMLTTKAVTQHALIFLRHCREEIAKLLARWPVLINAIDARHTVAVRWAKWLGFDMDEARPFGKQGLPFHRFSIRRAA